MQNTYAQFNANKSHFSKSIKLIPCRSDSGPSNDSPETHSLSNGPLPKRLDRRARRQRGCFPVVRNHNAPVSLTASALCLVTHSRARMIYARTHSHCVPVCHVYGTAMFALRTRPADPTWDMSQHVLADFARLGSLKSNAATQRANEPMSRG